jgi:hypothetical protein
MQLQVSKSLKYLILMKITLNTQNIEISQSLQIRKKIYARRRCSLYFIGPHLINLLTLHPCVSKPIYTKPLHDCHRLQKSFVLGYLHLQMLCSVLLAIPNSSDLSSKLTPPQSPSNPSTAIVIDSIEVSPGKSHIMITSTNPSRKTYNTRYTKTCA